MTFPAGLGVSVVHPGRGRANELVERCDNRAISE
jgi:hypothetical protein